MVFENEVNLYGDAPIANKFSSHDTQFDVVQGEINAIISESEMAELIDGGSTMYSAMNNIKVDVQGVHGDISELSTTVDGQTQQITSINSKQASYEASLNQFSASLSQTQADLSTTNTNLSALQLDTSQFKTTVASTYATKTQAQGYANTAEENAINTASEDATSKANAAEGRANTATDNKLKNYSTTQSVQSMIDQKADQITLNVSSTYATKSEAQTAARTTITGDTLYYLATASGSGVTTSTSGWTTTPQTMTATKKYLWTYHKYTYGDGHTSNTSPVITGTYGEKGDQGNQGTSVTVSKTEYQSGTSATSAPTGTWSTSIPSVSEGNYLWTKVTYSDGNVAYSVAKQGKSGTNGTNGKDGTSVTVKSIAYAYKLSTSGTTIPTGSWEPNPVAPTETQYAWTRTTTTFSDNSQAITYTVGGKNGSSATAYTLIVSHAAVVKTKGGSFSPASITVSAKSQVGASALSNYSGRFKIETSADNSSWTTRYTSSSDENSHTYTLPSGSMLAIRCSLYLAGGTSVLLDQQTIPIVTDGTDGSNGSNGKNGADAYTIILTNENHTFAGNATSAIASNTDCYVIAYKGAIQTAATIGSISGAPTGMTTTIYNNSTTNARFNVAVTSSMTTKNGVLTVPVTVDGKVFQMKFTYSLALKGDTGTGISQVTPLYYAKNNSTAPSAPTSKITTTTINTGVWTKAIPALTDTYKYLFTCDQVEYDNGTITWTSVVEDKSSSDVYTRLTTAEQKVTDSAIISTVTQSGQFPTKGEIILAINENDQSEAKINADKIELSAYSTLDQLSQVAAEKNGSFYGGEEPTNNNYPASDWNTSDIRQTHLGDLYYNKSNGFVYQYSGTSNGLLIKFNDQSKTESERYDYVIIYYQSGGKTYASEKLGGSSIGGKEIFVPAKDFWLYWHTDGSVNNYYGFSIDSVSVVSDRETPSFSFAAIPSYTVTDTTSYSSIASPHSPYVDNANQLWHYTYSGSITITTSYSWKRRKDHDLTAAESNISALGDQIALKVSKGDVIAAINLTSEEAKINASRINLEGYLTVTSASSTYASKSAASANEQYIYYQTTATTIYPTTTWITNSSDTYGEWTTIRPRYRSDYPKIFIAKQSKSVDGTVTCTTPVIDQTTTVIDGGSITTGYINADRIHGGTFKAGGYNNTNGEIEIYSNNLKRVGLWNKNGLYIGNVDGTDKEPSDANTTIGISGAITTKSLTANDYVYVDGNTSSYFKVPCTYSGRFAEVSSAGFKVRNSEYEVYMPTNHSNHKGLYIRPLSDSASVADNVGMHLDPTVLNIYDPSSTSGSSFSASYAAIRMHKGGSSGWALYLRYSGSNWRCDVDANFTVKSGYSKSKSVITDNYSERLLYCYEMPSPMFGDVGEGVIGDDGLCYVTIDPIFAETIDINQYQVFLQAYGDGKCFVKERKSSYFVVQGEPGLQFGWEIKGKQIDLPYSRLERRDVDNGSNTSPNDEVNYVEEAINHLTTIKQERTL